MDYVQILNKNEEEAIYYYKNNWEKLRVKAVEAKFIKSYQLLRLSESDTSDYHIILLTTYANQEQFDKREENFGRLIEARGDRKLLNEKQPDEFRKIVKTNESVGHLED
ncbi:hypothetical protein E1140_14660 [Fulvivirga lutimaris]|nr:hypothetical protein [Fulvivirga lutimaris]